jgi:hypothetical protein
VEAQAEGVVPLDPVLADIEVAEAEIRVVLVVGASMSML